MKHTTPNGQNSSNPIIQHRIFELVEIEGEIYEMPAGHIQVEGILRGSIHITLADGNYVIKPAKPLSTPPVHHMAKLNRLAAKGRLH